VVRDVAPAKAALAIDVTPSGIAAIPAQPLFPVRTPLVTLKYPPPVQETSPVFVPELYGAAEAEGIPQTKKETSNDRVTTTLRHFVLKNIA
jgi:hypothetical protein